MFNTCIKSVSTYRVNHQINSEFNTFRPFLYFIVFYVETFDANVKVFDCSDRSTNCSVEDFDVRM